MHSLFVLRLFGRLDKSRAERLTATARRLDLLSALGAERDLDCEYCWRGLRWGAWEHNDPVEWSYQIPGSRVFVCQFHAQRALEVHSE